MNIVILSFASFVLGSATWRTPPVDNGGGGGLQGARESARVPVKYASRFQMVQT